MKADLLPDLSGFVWIWFQINIRFSGNTTFIHRQSATDYKAHGSDFRRGSITVTLSRTKMTVDYTFISSTLDSSLY